MARTGDFVLMAGRSDPAEKVARAAARVLHSIGDDRVEQAREVHARVKGAGGHVFVTNGRLVALADAVAEWEAARGK